MLEPIQPGEWGAEEAAHLLARAGFGATPAEIEATARKTPEQAVEDLLAFPPGQEGAPVPDWVKGNNWQLPEPPKNASGPEKNSWNRHRDRMRRMQFTGLRGWWLDRMRTSPFPLQEKLVLFWHGHFATAETKVQSAYALYKQNQVFRRYAAGHWRDLIIAVGQDPAMLLYLDNAQNRKGAPNENFARELMELFTLGIGNYTEKDVQEAARAFTGWTMNRKEYQYQYQPGMHDDGDKTFLGLTGKLFGEDVVAQILKQASAAPFLAHKFWTFFVSTKIEPNLLEGLAANLRDNNFELRPFLKMLFLSREFYDPSLRHNQVKSPVQWLVGTAKALESSLPSTLIATQMLQVMGQDLFNPPNVKGWDGGTTWITANTLTYRYNFAGFLIKGGQGQSPFRGLVDMGPVRNSMTDAEIEALPDGGLQRDLANESLNLLFLPLKIEPVAPAEIPPPPHEFGEKLAKASHDLMEAPPPETQPFVSVKSGKIENPGTEIIIPDSSIQALLGPTVSIQEILPADRRGDKAAVVQDLAWRVYQTSLGHGDEQKFLTFVEKWPEPVRWSDEQVRDLLQAMLSRPLYQLC